MRVTSRTSSSTPVNGVLPLHTPYRKKQARQKHIYMCCVIEARMRVLHSCIDAPTRTRTYLQPAIAPARGPPPPVTRPPIRAQKGALTVRRGL